MNVTTHQGRIHRARRAHDPDTIPVRELIGNAEVRRLAGGVTRHTLINWRESRDFPQPLNAPKAGVELWDRRQVRAWIARNRG